MPLTKSAERALRKSLKRRERNLYHLTKMRNEIRLFKKEVERLSKEGFTEDSKKEIYMKLGKLYSLIDHTAAKGVIHKNEANRRKSRVTNFLNKFLKKSPEDEKSVKA